MTKDKIPLCSLHFCRRACFLFSNLISESVAVIRLSGYPCSIRLALKCEILDLNSFSEELRGSEIHFPSFWGNILLFFFQPTF